MPNLQIEMQIGISVVSPASFAIISTKAPMAHVENSPTKPIFGPATTNIKAQQIFAKNSAA